MKQVTQLHGSDVNLEISLFEYGLLICKREPMDYDDEWFAVYKINGGFDTSHVRESTIKNFMEGSDDWFVPKDVLEYCGQTLEEFLTSPFIHQLSTAISYYGAENFFGSSYFVFTLDEVNNLLGTDFEDSE